MEKQIKSTKVSYIKNGNVTVCLMDVQLSDDLAYDMAKANLEDRFNLSLCGEKLFHFKGIARCSEDDTYDEKVGEQVARRKAKIKMLKKLYKINKAIQDYHGHLYQEYLKEGCLYQEGIIELEFIAGKVLI